MGNRFQPLTAFGALILVTMLPFGGLSQQDASKKGVTLPLPVYVNEIFIPSGWMGDYSDIDPIFNHDRCERPSDDNGLCIKIAYSPQSAEESPKGWAGIYWQFGDQNWGDEPGARIGDGKATRLVFLAKGERGGETVSFKAGGIAAPGKPYKDSLRSIREQRVTLTKEWQEFVIPLEGKNLSQVIGGFLWLATRKLNPKGCTIYLDEIRYE